LGDGIYFTNVLDKAAQYIGDAGFGRGMGTAGYIFQMTANLGRLGEDYRSAGFTDASDHKTYISPEWCVYHPNSQLRIYKAFKVQLINKNEMRDLKSKYTTGGRGKKDAGDDNELDGV
jgi:hypothetical protein